MIPSLRALVEQWRKDSDAYLKSHWHREASVYLKCADELSAALDAQQAALLALEQERDAFKAAVQEAHRRLDAAGVEKAEGRVCDDHGCQTKLGHRVKVVLSELAQRREESTD